MKKLSGADTTWNLEGEVQLDGGITSLSLSPDRSMVLAGTTAGKIFAVLTSNIDASGVRCISASHTDGIVQVAFGGQSDIFCTVCKDGSVYSWDLSDYERIATAVNNGRKCTAVAMCEKSSDVLVGFSNGTVSCYDAISKDKVQKERCVAVFEAFLCHA